MSRVNWCGEPTCRCGPEGVDHPEARKVIDGDVNEIRQSDLLGEALARWEGWEMGDPYDPGTLEQLLAAARTWHTLSKPTDELIDKGAKALAYEAGKDISTWDSTPDQFLNPWREKARVVVDALTDTAEPEAEQ